MDTFTHMQEYIQVHTCTHMGSLLSQRYMHTLPTAAICIWPPCQIPSGKCLTCVPISQKYFIIKRVPSDMDWYACTTSLGKPPSIH